MTRFRDTSEFGPTLDAAAERPGISATAVEKDYWVSEILRVSEDIDVLVLPGTRGRNTTDKLMKAMGGATAAGIDGVASPVGGSETGRHRSYEVRYTATRQATALIRTSVLLEMGVRGGTTLTR